VNLSQAFNKCWHDVESEYSRGHLNNSSTFAFAFLKSLAACQADLQYSYDGRIIDGEKYSPSLIIWRDDKKPQVLFIGRFSFHPQNKPLFQKKLSSLKESLAAPTVGVLLHEFVAGNQLSIPMPVSAGCDFGYFVVSDQDSIGKDHLAAIENLSEQEKSRFHYAYAAIHPECKIAPVFAYIAPAGRTQ
jgi:hypothetical protein